MKPTAGIPLLLFAVVLGGLEWRWWFGLIGGGLFWYGLPLLFQADWPLRWLRTLELYAAPSDKQYLVTTTDLPDGIAYAGSE